MTDAEVLNTLRALYQETGAPVTASQVEMRVREDLKRKGEEHRARNASMAYESLVSFVRKGLVRSYPNDRDPRFRTTFAPVDDTTSSRIVDIDAEMASLTKERQRLVSLGILRGTTEHVIGQPEETIDERILDIDRRMIALRRERERQVGIGKSRQVTGR